MNVEWTTQAERALDEAADYVFEEYGRDACDRFLFRVHHAAKLLEDHPHLGPEEPLLAERQMRYRSVVVGHLNKIVYCILDNQISIVDFGTPVESQKHLFASVHHLNIKRAHTVCDGCALFLLKFEKIHNQNVSNSG